MAIEIKILGWSAKGLRCPDHDLSFTKGENSVHKISLLQMPNGTGKTTTLKLLRAALAGPEIWSNGHDIALQFRKNKNTASGSFELRLLYNGSKRLTIELNFNFNDHGKVTYYTTGLAGKDEGFNIPSILRPILTPDFVNLLMFDGELAANLLDAESTNAQNSIEAIYQLHFFDRVKARIDEHWTEEANKSGTTGGKRELTTRMNKVQALKARMDQVKAESEGYQLKLTETTNKIDELEKDFRKEIEKDSELTQQLSQANDNLKVAEQQVAEKSLTVITFIKNPVELNPSFAANIVELKGNLDRVKLPGVAAREFFDEIADEDDCICGRPIDHVIKEMIRSRADQYLGSEEVAVLNAMKSDIKDRISSKDAQSITLPELIQELESAQQTQLFAKQNLDTIRELASERDPKTKEISDRIKQLHVEVGRLQTTLYKYEDRTNDSDTSWNLDILTRRHDQAEKDLAAVTKTKGLKERKDILFRILDNAFEQSKASINEEVCMVANKRIEELMPSNNIRIAAIDRSLKLADKDGGSMGETLAVGYAFLSSLFGNHSYSLPSVVDSPSGPIDLNIRPQIAKLIPNLADQFIAFVISSERGGFVRPMAEAAPGQINFITLFRKDGGDLEAGARTIKGFQESEDGIWLTDQAYFENFHTDKQ
ncbi:AAA family ATPase [Pedobacter punctiformis]|uniref:AAA family ATPase n=1 Tax=Pedobacter punctiformis TaxID=3004097 RepID=A0ABT4LE54_9SPHI|nr:AAA family ATPase [Pedobacter sp. HCMS5-2]MCZ4245463.1 AAA family ATPase [Pedobacter sp. HCMS5-2]